MAFLVLVVLLVALMIPLTAVILDSQVGRALAKRLEGSKAIGEGDASATRLAALESEVERLSRELQRLDEESSFLHRLLEKKESPGALLPPGDRDD
jgi:HAMP domain-containing protein